MTRYIVLIVLALILAIAGCSEKMELTAPQELAPLSVSVTINPETIPVTYGAGLFARIDGAVLPLEKAEWQYEGRFLSNAEAVTFIPQEVGYYQFSFRVKDAAGRDTTVHAPLIAIPLDSIYVPPDTVILPPDTVQLPPDTVIVVEYDTTLVYDSLYVYDTTFVVDSIHVVDSFYVYDTTIVIDTVFQNVYVTDTVYVNNLIYKVCKPWLITNDNMSVTINLGNPHAGTYTLAAFRKRLTENLPNELELKWDFGGGRIEYTSVHGEAQLTESFWNVNLPRHASITISFVQPQFAGKISGTTCWQYFKGNWFWLSQPVTE